MKKVTNFNLKPGTNELVLQKHFSVESIRHSQVIFTCIDLVKPATHLAILFADRREFIASENRERFTPPTGCGHTWRFFSPIAATWHFNLVPRLQVPLLSSILKNHVIKSPNLIG